MRIRPATEADWPAIWPFFDEAVARADRATDEAVAKPTGLDTRSALPSRRGDAHFTLRWILLHMVEEYARHNGHADLIRESIDGEVGDEAAGSANPGRNSAMIAWNGASASS